MASTLVVVAPLRGEGRIYRGSLVEFHGWVVVSMLDCDCASCAVMDPWSPDQRVMVRIARVMGAPASEWETLCHARGESFTRE